MARKPAEVTVEETPETESPAPIDPPRSHPTHDDEW